MVRPRVRLTRRAKCEREPDYPGIGFSPSAYTLTVSPVSAVEVSIKRPSSIAAMTIHVADERALLDGMLDVQREAIARLLEGIDDAEARERLVPSLTTPMGLVKHATFVEKVWFHSRVAGVPRAEVGVPDTVDESFVLEAADTVATVRQSFLDACDRSRAIAKAHELDEQFPWHRGPVTLRFIYAHMIAELARHAGHGDILTEQIEAARATTSA